MELVRLMLVHAKKLMLMAIALYASEDMFMLDRLASGKMESMSK